MEHPKFEQSLVLLKPDAVQRGLMGEIIRRFENTGLKLVAMKFVLATEDQCWKHYNKDDVWFEKKGQVMIENLQKKGMNAEKTAIEYGKDIIRANIHYMTASPLVAMVWEGNKATGIIKKLVGPTEPLTSDVGTIRGDYTIDSFDTANVDGRAVRNLVHCSEVPEDAMRETPIWFEEKELIKYKSIQEKILYDVNIDGLLE